MSSVVPNTIPAQVDFVVNHADQWSASFAAIGLSSAQASAYSALATALNNAYTSQREAKTASTNATRTLHAQLERALEMTGELVAVIKAYAETQADPTVVYNTAQIPSPKTPAPVPAPGAPSEMKATVDTVDGSVKVSWKSNNPPGSSNVVYQTWRKLATESDFSLMATGGEKLFIDSSIPFGAATVQYRVRGLRGQTTGDWSETLVVQFGTGTGSGVGVQSITAQFVQPALKAA